MDTTSKRSLKLHEELGGKIYTGVKKRIQNLDDLSLLYTPGVAASCIEIGKNKNLARKLTIKKDTIAVVSDGSAILGIGDKGAEAALPVMEGKAVLFKQLGGVNAFPLCINAHTVDEIVTFVKQVSPTFAGINLEDISAPRCFEIEQRLKAELDIPVMHDDQWGTATIVLAGLINALRLRGSEKENVKLVVNGAGAAGIAITKLLLLYGFKNITVVDTKGAIYKGRLDLTAEMKTREKYLIAKKTNLERKTGDLAGIICGTDIFIGVSAPNIVTSEMVRSMNEKPIIFALSNPIPEIIPDIAYKSGAFIVSTGGPHYPNQCNNCLVFPGVFRGVIDHGVIKITEEMLICVSLAIAGMIKKPQKNKILPSALNRKVVSVISKAIKKYSENNK